MALLRRILTLCLIVTLTLLITSEAGLWTRSEVYHGPFRSDGGQSVMLDVGGSGLGGCCIGARTDAVDAAARSKLQLWVNGVRYTEAHKAHSAMREGSPLAFSHWGDLLRLSLPAGQPNDASLSVRVSFPVQVYSSAAAAVLIALNVLALWFLSRQTWLTRSRVAVLARLPFFVTVVLVGCAAVLASVYAGVTAFAWVQGWGVPTTAALLRSGLGRWLGLMEPHAPELVLSLAVVGCLASWVAGTLEIDQTADEARTNRLLAIAGLPILAALLILSASAQWTGLSRQGDQSYVAIAGLVPFSDAYGYYADGHDVLKDGVYNMMGSRRPLAQSFRSTLLAASGYDYVGMLALQSLLLALAIFLAAWAVAQWRGRWAALAFAAMGYAVTREFASTSLTEPIGFFWAFCAIPPLVGALRGNSVRSAVVAMGLIDVSLFARMGSMFTLPALVIWIPACFGETRRAKLRIGAAALGVLLACAGLNSLAGKIYNHETGMVGSNFSYSLCGMSIGASWNECLKRYKDELPPPDGPEQARVRVMYQKAFENLARQPSVFVERVASGSYEFIKALPGILVQGYVPITPYFELGPFILELVAAVGLLSLLPRMPRREIVFWLLFWSSVAVSAGFVFFDDGRRVMAASYPVAILFFASGLRTMRAPMLESVRRHAFAPRAAIAAVAFAAALVIACTLTPRLLHAVARPSAYLSAEAVRKLSPAGGPQTRFVFGGKRMTGMLVVDDRDPLRTDVPTLHLSDFATIVRRSGIEGDQPLVTPQAPPVPFGIVAAPNLVEGEATGLKFIVPIEVMLRKDVPAWLFETAETKGVTTSYWARVTKAVPLTSDAANCSAKPQAGLHGPC